MNTVNFRSNGIRTAAHTFRQTDLGYESDIDFYDDAACHFVKVNIYLEFNAFFMSDFLFTIAIYQFRASLQFCIDAPGLCECYCVCVRLIKDLTVSSRVVYN